METSHSTNVQGNNIIIILIEKIKRYDFWNFSQRSINILQAKGSAKSNKNVINFPFKTSSRFQSPSYPGECKLVKALTIAINDDKHRPRMERNRRTTMKRFSNVSRWVVKRGVIFSEHLDDERLVGNWGAKVLRHLGSPLIKDAQKNPAVLDARRERDRTRETDSYSWKKRREARPLAPRYPLTRRAVLSPLMSNTIVGWSRA